MYVNMITLSCTWRTYALSEHLLVIDCVSAGGNAITSICPSGSSNSTGTAKVTGSSSKCQFSSILLVHVVASDSWRDVCRFTWL